MAYGGKGKENTTTIGSSDDSPDTTKYTGPVSNVLRPNANNIISGHARAPYDFESFVDFLSRNHCIEILDFLSEANAYSDSYYNSGASAFEERMTPETRRLGKQWKTIMSTYISPGSPNELNIPDGMRKELLNNHDVLIHPPNPTLLNPTIQHARELLADGVIIPFMNSIPLEIRSRSLSIDRYHPLLHLQVASETDTSTPRDAR
ncbi:hypothetical protein N7466_002749 [Penicillium verhagenii]|uniref:uncharacterized protein n=1 Tax=Penicillium verhagenii TaxID=1562060 RepID=UPI0025456A27|nr:uncharacterized protein N7466_002749 [Penicillium verhagenii]KAJ5939615.1 hypothetical protein N7466_002749 [Penicillium verhagenii]